MNKYTILLDLDGVLNSYFGEFDENKIPPLRDGAFEFIETLYQKYKLVLFSTRPINLVKKWVKENGVKNFFYKITNVKQCAHLIIDDRSICFNGNYSDTLEAVENFKVWWKKDKKSDTKSAAQM